MPPGVHIVYAQATHVPMIKINKQKQARYKNEEWPGDEDKNTQCWMSKETAHTTTLNS